MLLGDCAFAITKGYCKFKCYYCEPFRRPREEYASLLHHRDQHCDGHHKMADLGAVSEPLHSSGESIGPHSVIATETMTTVFSMRSSLPHPADRYP
jgi:hypothetical protein